MPGRIEGRNRRRGCLVVRHERRASRPIVDHVELAAEVGPHTNITSSPDRCSVTDEHDDRGRNSTEARCGSLAGACAGPRARTQHQCQRHRGALSTSNGPCHSDDLRLGAGVGGRESRELLLQGFDATFESGRRLKRTDACAIRGCRWRDSPQPGPSVERMVTPDCPTATAPRPIVSAPRHRPGHRTRRHPPDRCCRQYRLARPAARSDPPSHRGRSARGCRSWFPP